MKSVVVLLLVVFGQESLAGVDHCALTYSRCCITEFLRLANPDQGFSFTTQKIEESCMSVKDSFDCLEDFKEICKKQELLDAADVSHEVMSEMCTDGSEIQKTLKDEECLIKSSDELRNCSADMKFHGDGLQLECCKYKTFKDCALHISSGKCSENVAAHTKDFVIKVTGLGYEQICTDYFPHCNTAMSITSGVWLLLSSIFLNIVSLK